MHQYKIERTNPKLIRPLRQGRRLLRCLCRAAGVHDDQGDKAQENNRADNGQDCVHHGSGYSGRECVDQGLKRTLNVAFLLFSHIFRFLRFEDNLFNSLNYLSTVYGPFFHSELPFSLASPTLC